ncbi:MAG TPA: class I SAM-dependent rRNA methyltransferase [Bacteroidales bacterium]|nr:class I SAM-dependent rRNA methyltransferase [Bacteroidales bacterium]
MTVFPKIILKQGKDEALRRFHPWVFSGAIQKITGMVTEGCIIEVYSAHHEFLGTGHYNEGSITARIFSFEKTDCEKNFWKNRFESALNYRKKLGLCNNPSTNAYRLVHGEGDGLPGLIVDFYNGTAVIQCHTYGMYLLRQGFAEILKDLYGDKLRSVYLKSKETLPAKFSEDVHDGYLIGDAADPIITENGNRFFVDWEQGQKTGFFLDQRMNRLGIMPFCEDKKVLNTFCYSGGFSVYALNAGASLVHSVDSSARAIEMTDKNIELNGMSGQRHKSFRSDVMNFLRENDACYDVIVLDPPAYAKHLKTRHTAMQGYRRLNEAALQKINSGGFLFTFSCSQVVDTALFRSTIIAAAINSIRNVKIIGTLTQPPDHPVNAFHPEGEYLKGLVLFVE